jgi:hypothetical protein
VPSHGATPINIFQSDYKTSDIPIRLAYHDGNHYNAIIDPFLPTAGLGLGLPGLEPGLADKLQVQRAKEESDRMFMKQIARETHDMELKRALEESSKLSSMDYWMQKKRALEYSDLEETDFELEQIALLSSLEDMSQPRKEGTSDLLFHGASFGKKKSGSSCDHDADGSGSGSGSGGKRKSKEKKKRTSSSSSSSSFVTSSSSKNVAKNSTHTSVESNHSTNDGDTQQQYQQEEYPRIVQELVMNGFELSKVLKAYEFIGDNFDDLLSYLITTSDI